MHPATRRATSTKVITGSNPVGRPSGRPYPGSLVIPGRRLTALTPASAHPGRAPPIAPSSGFKSRGALWPARGSVTSLVKRVAPGSNPGRGANGRTSRPAAIAQLGRALSLRPSIIRLSRRGTPPRGRLVEWQHFALSRRRSEFNSRAVRRRQGDRLLRTQDSRLEVQILPRLRPEMVSGTNLSNPIPNHPPCGLVAQSAQVRLAFNQTIAGSNPAEPVPGKETGYFALRRRRPGFKSQRAQRVRGLVAYDASPRSPLIRDFPWSGVGSTPSRSAGNIR